MEFEFALDFGLDDFVFGLRLLFDFEVLLFGVVDVAIFHFLVFPPQTEGGGLFEFGLGVGVEAFDLEEGEFGGALEKVLLFLFAHFIGEEFVEEGDVFVGVEAG